MSEKNRIIELLTDLGISSRDSIEAYYGKVRDRDDISVLRCNRSGVILLSRTDHIDKLYYEDKSDFKYWKAADRREALKINFEDDNRRFEQHKSLVSNRSWLDVGTGAGGILDLLSPVVRETSAVEPQEMARRALIDMGYTVHKTIGDSKDNHYEIVTLFHVLEHLLEPIDSLKQILGKMKAGGKVIIEIPHANDFLISFLDNEAFKSFTFWSEHLILHTRESITLFLQEAGFTNIVVKGYQRYPLANHLFWLAKGKPGGHIQWTELRNEALDREYANMLNSIDKTDTLTVIAEKAI